MWSLFNIHSDFRFAHHADSSKQKASISTKFMASSCNLRWQTQINKCPIKISNIHEKIFPFLFFSVSFQFWTPTYMGGKPKPCGQQSVRFLPLLVPSPIPACPWY